MPFRRAPSCATGPRSVGRRLSAPFSPSVNAAGEAGPFIVARRTGRVKTPSTSIPSPPGLYPTAINSSGSASSSSKECWYLQSAAQFARVREAGPIIPRRATRRLCDSRTRPGRRPRRPRCGSHPGGAHWGRDAGQRCAGQDGTRTQPLLRLPVPQQNQEGSVRGAPNR